jgi:hypothetical protein
MQLVMEISAQMTLLRLRGTEKRTSLAGKPSDQIDQDADKLPRVRVQ